MNVYQIARQISPADAARRLGLKETRGRFLCPFHEDRHPSMACYEDSHRFYCFSCHARGDATDLWAKVTGLPAWRAAEALCKVFGLQEKPESRQEAARRQRVEDVAMLPQAVWQDWQRCMLTLLDAEFDACTRLLEAYPDPEGWLWEFAIRRATKLQDERNRLEAIAAKDLAAEVEERRRSGEVRPDQPEMGEALLRAMLSDRLRHTGMRLNAQESEYVCKTLGISGE